MKEESLKPGCNCTLIATNADSIGKDIDDFLLSAMGANQGPFLVIRFAESESKSTICDFMIDIEDESVTSAKFMVPTFDSDFICTAYEYGLPLVLNYLNSGDNMNFKTIVIQIPEGIGVKTTMKIVAKTNIISLLQEIPDIYAFYIKGENIYSLEMKTEKKKKKKKGKK